MNKVKTIRCYDYVNHPYEPVRDSLSAEDSTVFQDATKAATSHAQTLTSESRVNATLISLYECRTFYLSLNSQRNAA
jgi:hypothetical protein